jgi:hypothetical protein
MLSKKKAHREVLGQQCASIGSADLEAFFPVISYLRRRWVDPATNTLDLPGEHPELASRLV